MVFSSDKFSVDGRIAFLKEVSELPKVVLNSEAFVDSRSALAELAAVSGQLEHAKVKTFSFVSVSDLYLRKCSTLLNLLWTKLLALMPLYILIISGRGPPTTRYVSLTVMAFLTKY